MKQTIRLTESQLRQIVTESIKQVLQEGMFDNSLLYSTYQGYEDVRNNPKDEPIRNWKRTKDYIKNGGEGGVDQNEYYHWKNDVYNHYDRKYGYQVGNGRNALAAYDKKPGVSGKIARAANVGAEKLGRGLGKVHNVFNKRKNK